MKTSRPLLVMALAALTACGGDSTGPTVTQVSVTPGTSTVNALGETVQFSARATDNSGNVVSGETVTWSSSDVSVATVSSSGLATAVGAGTSAITATVAGVAGSAVLNVTPIADCEAAQEVSLAPGEWAKYDATECILLPSGSNGDRYRVILTRPKESGTSNDVVDATLRVSGIGVTESPPAPVAASTRDARELEPIPGASARTLLRSLRIAENTARRHMELRRQEAEMIRRLGAEGLLPRRAESALGRVVAAAASPDKILIDTSTSSDCADGDSVTAVLIHENDALAVYQDSTQNANKPIPVGLAQQLATYYQAHGADMIEDYFGAPTDIDGNGKIILFATPIVSSNQAAFVWNGDFFSKEQCPASNEREIIYFNTDLILDMDPPNPDNRTFQALETVAHEAYHVVSLYHRIRWAIDNGIQSGYNHPLWMDEGRAEIAGEMSSRVAWAATGGPAVNAAVTRDDLVNSGLTAENYGVFLRLARTIAYLSSQPNGMVVTPTGARTGHDIYGSGWNFNRFVGDEHGGAATAPYADASLFKALTDSLTDSGFDGLQTEVGQGFTGLFDGFAVAVALHGTGAAPSSGFQTYDFISATNDILRDQQQTWPGSYPWAVTGTSTNPVVGFKSGTYEGPLGPAGIRIHDFRSNGTGTGAQITADVSPPAKMLVVRIN